MSQKSLKKRIGRTLVIRTWGDKNGKDVAQIRQNERGTQYFCLFLYTPTLSGGEIKTLRDVREVRLSVLKDAAVWVAEMYEQSQVTYNPLPDSWLESLLDFIYLELNRRLNKTKI